MKIRIFLFAVIFGCTVYATKEDALKENEQESISHVVSVNIEDDFIKKLVQGAIERTKRTQVYDPAYKKINYPNGDVPDDRGVCTDVIVRSYRTAGIDLQKEIHEDMKKNFSKYPQNWGLRGPDPNIDHRRVPNLMKYFERQDANKIITSNPYDFFPGDIVVWKFDNGLLHIGLVINEKIPDSGRFLVVHNSGRGTRKEDVLFNWEIIGHYRYKN